MLAAAAATANPVDLTADGTAAMLERALDIVLADDAVDAVITAVVETLAISAAAARHVIDRVAQRAGKPVVACSVGAAAPSGPSGAARVAEIPSPERAAVALGRVCGYAQWRRRAMLPAREPEEPSDHPVIRETSSLFVLFPPPLFLLLPPPPLFSSSPPPLPSPPPSLLPTFLFPYFSFPLFHLPSSLSPPSLPLLSISLLSSFPFCPDTQVGWS